MHRTYFAIALPAALGLLTLSGLADDKPYSPKVLGPSNEAGAGRSRPVATTPGSAQRRTR